MGGRFGTATRTTPMQKVWSDASAKYVVEQASKVRENAAKWGQSATAILAVAGLATAFKGRETLDALDTASQGPLVTAVLVALASSGAALSCAAWAVSGTTGWTWDDPESFRSAQSTAAAKAAAWLKASVVFLVMAFLASIFAVFLIWTSAKAAATPEQTLVVGEGRIVGCGELTVSDGALLVDGKEVPGAPVTFHTTTECPE